MIEPAAGPAPESQPTRAPASTRWRSLLLLIFSLIAILVLLGRGVYLVIRSASGAAGSATQSADIFSAVSMLFCALLLAPVFFLSARRLRGLAIGSARVPPVNIWAVVLLVVVWVIAIAASVLSDRLGPNGWIIAFPGLILGIAIPVAILLWIAIGGIPTGSWRRLWAALGLGMTLSTTVAIVLELLTVGLAAVLAGAIAAIDPSLRATLEQLRSQLTHAANPEDLLPILTPYLNNPLLILIALFFVAGVGPLIEEAFKPLAVWLVGKRLRSPAEGFALGALCGAGFAILEGMLVSSGATDMVGISVAARATSSLMHITASALMGWAIASAILLKKYGRLIWTYLLSLTLHGLWNGAVVLTVYGGLRVSSLGTSFDLLGGLSTFAGIALLGALVVGILIALPLINWRLRKKSQIANDIIAPTLS
jgi:hypothetical protein